MPMIRIKYFFPVVLLLLLLSPVFADDFCADMITSTGSQNVEGRIFVGKDKIRMETQSGVVISLMDKKVTWLLMPGQKNYIEQVFDPASLAAISDHVPGEVKRQFIGRSEVGGRDAKEYRVVTKYEGKDFTIRQWFIPEVKMPVKVAAEDGSWTMEYKNIDISPQPDSLFKVPDGYTKVNMESMTQ